MSNIEQVAQAAIHVDERYFYDVDLGTQPMITWNSEQSKIEARVVIPYDAQLSYDGKQLKDIPPDQTDLPLGEIVVHFPGDGQLPDYIPIVLPAGLNLSDRLQSGQQLSVRWSYPAPQPQNTLVTVNGAISDRPKQFDAAEQSNDAKRTEALRLIMEEKPEAFVNNLRLRISLWVPDLFERTQRRKDQALREMLREQEHERQILIQDVDDIELLAQSLVALANSVRGGRILIGVGPRGLIKGIAGKKNKDREERVELALLRAGLRCQPLVPFAAPDFFRDGHDDIYVAQVIIPKGLHETYRYNGKRYHREGNITAVERLSFTLPRLRPVVSKPLISHLEDVFRVGFADDVVVINAGRDLSHIPLGAAICGLINAGQNDGIVLISNLPSPKGWPVVNQFSYGPGSVVRQIEEKLEAELECCTPRPLIAGPWLTRIKGELVAILRIARVSAPVVLYQARTEDMEQADTAKAEDTVKAGDTAKAEDKAKTERPFIAYSWSDRSLKNLKIHDVLSFYLQRLSKGGTSDSDKGDIEVIHGELKWPIQPVNSMEQSMDCSYDVQRQAMVWKNRSFEEVQGTGGQHCHLDVLIRHALMTVGDNGVAGSTHDPILKGMIYLRFDDVLASQLNVYPQADKRTGMWFNRIPVHRRTFVQLNVQVRTDELFTQRRKASLIRFSLPDVNLDDDRIADLIQAFADLGFRLDPFGDDHIDKEGTPPNWIWITGIRSKHFCDITLYALVLCERTKLTREFRYEQRFDRKQTHVALLDVRIALVGSGDQAAEQIAHLHLDAHQLISERLQYLRTE